MTRAYEARLRLGTDEETLDVRDLEDQVRRGERPREATLLYPPWTGPDWRPIGEIAELAAAWEGPGARLVAHIRAARVPVGAGLLLLLVLCAGVLQLGLHEATLGAADWTDRYDGLLGQLMVGAAPLLLDGRWWTPLTAPLVHANAGHLLSNLPILAYCGYRVEKALGTGAIVLVAAAALLGSTLLIVMGSALPVVGASTIAYGLWGAQIAAGFRLGDTIPPGYRRYYGWGNLFIFAPLYATSFGNPAASHLGHAGGLIGGVLAAFLLRPDSEAPSAALPVWRRRNLVLAALLALMPSLLAPIGAAAPGLVLGGMSPVEVPELGLALSLPGRMNKEPLTYLGMRAWVLDPNDEEPLFAGLWFHNDPTIDLDAASQTRWESRLEGVASPAPAPAPLGPGWTAAAYTLPAASGTTWRIVEHSLQRGRYTLRVGYTLRDDRWGPGRERLYDSILRTVQPGDPPAVVEARHRLSLLPGSARLQLAYAEKLGLAGQIAEAEAALDGVKDPDWTWTVVDDRLWLAVEFPGQTRQSAGERARAALREAPLHEEGLLLRAIDQLQSEGDCAALADFQSTRLSPAPGSGLAAALNQACPATGD